MMDERRCTKLYKEDISPQSIYWSANNVDAKSKDNDGWDPLYIVMAWWEEQAAQLIFNNVFNVDTVPQVGECFGWYSENCTLLHRAAHLGCDGAIEAMLEPGADPHATTSLG